MSTRDLFGSGDASENSDAEDSDAEDSEAEDSEASENPQSAEKPESTDGSDGDLHARLAAAEQFETAEHLDAEESLWPQDAHAQSANTELGLCELDHSELSARELYASEDDSPELPVRRSFLGWGQPLLPRVAQQLLDEHPDGDLGDILLVLPGRRAGRRLLELLTDAAQARQLAWTPPRFTTPGMLPQQLVRPFGSWASESERQLLWMQILEEAKPEELHALVPTPPDPEAHLPWLPIARLLERQQRELAHALTSFHDIEEQSRNWPDFPEAPRWQVCATLESRYRRRLQQLALDDPDLAWLDSDLHLRLHAPAKIIWVALVELPPLTEALALRLSTSSPQAASVKADAGNKIPTTIESWVFAPEALADRFDANGALIPGRWIDRPIRGLEQRWIAVDRPPDQAHAVARQLRKYEGRYSATDITIGVADEDVLPFLEQTLRRARLQPHYAGGTPLTRSRPYHLLSSLADYLEQPSYRSWVNLLRHPDIERFIHSKLSDDASRMLLARCDRFQQRHLPAIVDPRLFQQHDALLAEANDALETLLTSLRGNNAPLERWCLGVSKLLETLYGSREFDLELADDERLWNALLFINDGLTQLRAVATELLPSLSAAGALRFMLEQGAQLRLPQASSGDDLELLGWLEILLDDTPIAVITGFNEGCIPSRGAQSFLPDTVRAKLGLSDDKQRLARDSYALQASIESRRDLFLVAGRRDLRNDPLTPSRLLFATDADGIAHRVQAFFDDTVAASPLPEHGRAGAALASQPTPGTIITQRDQTELAVPCPDAHFPLPQEPIEQLSVTGFRDYIACPYRFYLNRVLRLRALDDRSDELDPLQFGILCHDVLQRFGEEELTLPQPDTDSEAIARRIDAHLDSLCRERYGSAPLATVSIQIEQARDRIAPFAPWQAQRAEEGWCIEHVELSLEKQQVPFDVDGVPFYLVGRIDRVDVHARTGQRMLFDYKTSDQARPPEKMHRRGHEWIDLQLPLYRHLAAAAGLGDEFEMAYVVFPKDRNVQALEAQWDTMTLFSADERARQVVRAVRQQIFWPPRFPPPRAEYDDFAWICQTQQRELPSR